MICSSSALQIPLPMRHGVVPWLQEEEERARAEEAAQRAVVLEMVGDLPDADAKPPSNMLFVCKLNPVTTEEVGKDVHVFVRNELVKSCCHG